MKMLTSFLPRHHPVSGTAHTWLQELAPVTSTFLCAGVAVISFGCVLSMILFAALDVID